MPYLGLISEVADRFLSDRDGMRAWTTEVDWRGPISLAGLFAYLAEQTGRDDYARAARDLLPKTGALGSFCVYPTVRAYLTLRRLGFFSHPEQSEIESYLVSQAQEMVDGDPFRHFIGYRVFNHVLMAALGLDHVGRSLLDGRVPPKWKQYIDETWRDCRAIGYPLENASNYEPISLHVLLFWETLRDDPYLKDDARIRDMMERNLQLLSPIGVMPDYGDTSWNPSWGMYIANFEIAAAVYGDGRFRWAAARLLDYQLRTRESWLDGPGLPSGLHLKEVYQLTYALDILDDTINLEMPESATAITYRGLPHFYQETLTPISTARSAYPVGEGERRQDKLVFRSGWGERDAYAAIELQSRLWHDHYGAPAIIMSSIGDSVLMADNGYWPDRPEFHNTFFVQPLGESRPFAAGMVPGEGPSPGRCHQLNREFGKPLVCSCDDFKAASFASIHTVPYMAYPTYHRRYIVFAKASGTMFIWDRLRAWEGEYEAGPLIHTQKVVSEVDCGFISRINQLYSHHAGWTPNGPAGVLTAFFSAGGRIGSVRQRCFEHRPPGLEVEMPNEHCLYICGPIAQGEERGFLTCIVPLRNGKPPTRLEGSADAQSAEACLDDLSVAFSDGRAVNAGPISADAAFLFSVRNGDSVEIAFKNASRLELEGAVLLRTGEKNQQNALYEETNRVTGEITVSRERMTAVLYSMIDMNVTLFPPLDVIGISVDGEAASEISCPTHGGITFSVAGRLDLALEFRK